MAFALHPFWCLSLVLLTAVSLLAQGPDHYAVSPEKTTMLIGESRPFRMVDQNGRAQHKVTWTISDADAFQSFEGDELILTARRAGDFRLTARTDFVTAEASVRVMDGPALPVGTIKWAAGKMDGCNTTKIIPAVPRPNGPDIFVQSQCTDGEYIAAYTSDGILLWRRKMSDNGSQVSPGGGSPYEGVARHLEPHSSSICDSVTAGTEQQKIRELLTQQNLSYREESAGGRVWLVEESSTQCRLWFDEKSVLVKKRKVFVAQ